MCVFVSVCMCVSMGEDVKWHYLCHGEFRLLSIKFCLQNCILWYKSERKELSLTLPPLLLISRWSCSSLWGRCKWWSRQPWETAWSCVQWECSPWLCQRYLLQKYGCQSRETKEWQCPTEADTGTYTTQLWQAAEYLTCKNVPMDKNYFTNTNFLSLAERHVVLRWWRS